MLYTGIQSIIGSMNRFLFLLLVLLVLVIFQVFPEDTSDNLRLGIVMIENPQSDAGIGSLCETATDTIEITLRMADKYDIERLDFLLPGADLERAKLYFRSRGFDNAVFGQIKGNEADGYTFIIEGWERKSDKILVHIEETAMSVFDLFDIADNLTLELFEELTGEHLGFGRMVYQREGIEADYDIEIDGNYLGRNIGESVVVEGKRKFTIRATGRYGDVVVKTAIIDIEENGEYSIGFSMDDIIPSGNLFIDADPEGSEVFIEDRSIGFTPLSLYDLEARPYNLRVGKEYFIPVNQVLDLEPNIDNVLSFDLGIDAEHPDIKRRLKDPVRTELITAGVTAGQVAWLIGRSLIMSNDGFDMNYLDALILAPRYGHLLMGDTRTGTILSLVSLIGLTGMTGMYDPLLGTSMNEGGDLYGVLLGLAVGSSIIYDLVGAPFAGAKWNEKFLGSLKEEGISFDKKEEKDPFRYTIQTGGGGIVHCGVSWAPLWNWLYLEQLAGVSLTQYYDILEPALTTTTKVLFYPLPGIMSFFSPYLGGLFILGSDFNSINFAYGLASGFEISLPWLDIFLEADLSISNEFGTVPVTMALGVRL